MKLISDIRFKAFNRLMALLLLLMAGGCVKNEFTLEFRLPENVNYTYSLFYYGSDRGGGVTVDAAVAVSAGKGALQGITRYPTVVYIYYGSKDIPACIVYAERGDKIVLEGKSENPEDWNVTGNKVNGAISEFRRENAGLIGEASKSSEGAKPAIHRRLNAAVKRYVEAHKDNVASLIILTTYYDASVDSEGFLRLLNLLQKNGVPEDGSTIMNVISRQDMLTSTRIAPASKLEGGDRVKDMVVKSYERNLDTLRASSGKKPLLIYLWRRDDAERQADIDSLKRLVKWRGDSAAMPIADICLDSDSASWTYALKGDTLRQVLHAWMPRGAADEALMRLGVAGSPWWVVIGPDGRLILSGADREEAFKSFRNLKKKVK